ncbi:MAG: serine aminopeptidase domain-containing protein [Mycoplasma sp.]
MINEKHLNQKRKNNPENTIIFFHGIFSDANAMPQMIDIAEQKNFDFLAYTMPLHGDNKDYDMQQGLTIEHCCKIIEGLLKKVRTKNLIIVGHSAGASWAVKCHEFAKENFNITNIIFVSPINSSLKAVSLRKIQNLIETLNEENYKITKSIEDFYDVKKHSVSLTKIEKILYLKYIMQITDKKILLLNNLAIERIKVPSIVISGKHDLVIDPLESFQVFKIINNNIKYEIFPNSGHNPHNDETERFKSMVLSFIEKNNFI